MPASLLTVPRDCDLFLLQTNASGRGISGVLHVCRDGEEFQWPSFRDNF